RPGSRFFLVNEEQRQRFEGRCDYIIPLVFRDERTALVYKPVPHSAVAAWKLLTPQDAPSISSPCRSIAIECLEPATCLYDLFPASPDSPNGDLSGVRLDETARHATIAALCR